MNVRPVVTRAALLTCCLWSTAASSSGPPPTPTDNVIDTYFGVRVPDPYRWLEDGNSPRVRAWSTAQNAYARAALDALGGRAPLRAEIAKLLSLRVVSVPKPAGKLLFFTRRDAGQNQPVLLVAPASGGKPRVLVDPNKLSAQGLVALDWWYPSQDGRYLAYGLSRNGDEQSTLYVVHVESGRPTSEKIAYTRAGPVAWLPDDSGFYYARWRHMPTGAIVQRRIYFHRLGIHPDGTGDTLIFGTAVSEAYWADVDLSRNGRWLVLYTYHGAQNANDVEIRDRANPQTAPIVVNRGNDKFYLGEVVGDAYYAITDDGAERGKLVRINLLGGNRAHRRTVIPETRAELDMVNFAGGDIVAEYLDNATSRLKIFDIAGRLRREIPLPQIGTVPGVGSEQPSPEIYYSFTSFNVPTTVYRYDLRTGKHAVWAHTPVPFDPSRYALKQVWYRSKDGTRVPMFVMHRKGLRLDGAAPAYLTGYGGFEINITPAFSYRALMWVERGGVFAEPNLRGGAEFGEAWHRAGMLQHKQNVFDDFIAAANWLIDHHYTSPRRLAIAGGSNGGLLVAAAETQAPQLFRAVDCEVPLTDMLRYHKFLIARLWISEYGSSENPRQFRNLLKYSPYQNVRKGTSYPATLIMTAEDDSRVDPMNARKLAARLQAESAGPSPIYLYIEPKAGHGAGTPVGKSISRTTDVLAFLMHEVGLQP